MTVGAVQACFVNHRATYYDDFLCDMFRQVHYLVAGANGVRKLVRVKIADDNDLEQARKALKSTDMFFKALYHRAKESNMTPYALLQEAEKFSYV